MFGIGMPELMLIFVLALLVFGPKELPKIARTLGKAMAELRRASDELRDGIQREIDLAEREEERPSAPTEPVASTTHAESASPAPEAQPGEAPAGAPGEVSAPPPPTVGAGGGEAAMEQEAGRAEAGPSMTTDAAEPAMAAPPSEATETPGTPEATPEDSSRAATPAPAAAQPIESRNA